MYALLRWDLEQFMHEYLSNRFMKIRKINFYTVATAYL